MAMSSRKLPDIDDYCSQHFRYRDLIECGTTYQKVRPDNQPTELATYDALKLLAKLILDPVMEEFGGLELTYGVATSGLLKHIKTGIAPRLDQHASYELNTRGNRICDRDGAAADFKVPSVSGDRLARWVVRNTNFDRLYFYSAERPIHVSTAPNPCRQCTVLVRTNSKHAVPKSGSVDNFLSILAEGAPAAK